MKKTLQGIYSSGTSFFKNLTKNKISPDFFSKKFASGAMRPQSVLLFAVIVGASSYVTTKVLKRNPDIKGKEKEYFIPFPK